MPLMKLTVEAQYAAIELFRGTMVRHSVIAYRSDRPARGGLDFHGDDWLRYTRIRLPRYARCTGSAAVGHGCGSDQP